MMMWKGKEELMDSKEGILDDVSVGSSSYMDIFENPLVSWKS